MSGVFSRLTKRRNSSQPPRSSSSTTEPQPSSSIGTAAVLPQTLVEEPEEIGEGKGRAEDPDSASPLRRAIAGLRLIIQVCWLIFHLGRSIDHGLYREAYEIMTTLKPSLDG
jgi:hypothetical protein